MKDCALLCWDTRTRTRKGRTRICSVTITPYPNFLCNRNIAWLRVQRYGENMKSPNIFPTFFNLSLIFARFMTKHLYLFLLIYHFYGFVAHIVILFEYVALDITHHLRLWLYSFKIQIIDRGQWDTAYSRAESPKAHSPGQRPGFLDVIAIFPPIGKIFSPVGKILFPNWGNIFFQLEKYILVTGRFSCWN